MWDRLAVSRKTEEHIDSIHVIVYALFTLVFSWLMIFSFYFLPLFLRFPLPISQFILRVFLFSYVSHVEGTIISFILRTLIKNLIYLPPLFVPFFYTFFFVRVISASVGSTYIPPSVFCFEPLIEFASYFFILYEFVSNSFSL